MLAGGGWDAALRRRRWVLIEMLFVLQAKLKDVFRRNVEGRGSKLSVNHLGVDVVKMLSMVATMFVRIGDFLPLIELEIMYPIAVREDK